MTIDLEEYVRLEEQFARGLIRAWHPLAAKVFSAIREKMDAGEFEQAYEAAKGLDFSDLGEKKRPYIRKMLVKLAKFGSMVLSDTPQFNPKEHDKLFDHVTSGFLVLLEHSMTLKLYTDAIKYISKEDPRFSSLAQKDEVKPRIKLKTPPVEQAEDPVEVPAAKPRIRLKTREDAEYAREFVSFAQDGDQQLQLISSLHSSRMAVFGFVTEAELLEVQEYKLVAVLDGRTSEFCRLINGKRFKVADAARSINAVLSVENPEDVRQLQPWPKQNQSAIDEYSQMTAAELTAKGLHIPPFHPKCRTICVSV